MSFGEKGQLRVQGRGVRAVRCLRKGQPGFSWFIFTFDLLVKESCQANFFQHKDKTLNLIGDWQREVVFLGRGCGLRECIH